MSDPYVWHDIAGLCDRNTPKGVIQQPAGEVLSEALSLLRQADKPAVPKWRLIQLSDRMQRLLAQNPHLAHEPIPGTGT